MPPMPSRAIKVQKVFAPDAQTSCDVHVAEGADDKIGLHEAGDFRAEVVRAEGEEIAGGADKEKEGNGHDECS